jgi:hypothetical protein
VNNKRRTIDTGEKMPFLPPFKKYSSYDLVYGVGEARTRYFNCHPDFKLSIKGSGRIIDEYMPGERRNGLPKNNDSFTNSILGNPDPRYNSLVGGSFDNRLYFKRKCKAGLRWVIASQDERCVHFLLDELNLDLVIGEGLFDDGEPFKSRSYTASELRWVYRHRNDPQVQKKVQFWLNLIPVSPPWFGPRGAIWQRIYKPKSEPEPFIHWSGFPFIDE